MQPSPASHHFLLGPNVILVSFNMKQFIIYCRPNFAAVSSVSANQFHGTVIPEMLIATQMVIKLPPFIEP
jgi:hypothetical protein